MALFVDTSAWYAAVDAGDSAHARAKALLSTGESLDTSDHVLVETWSLLDVRIGSEVAERFWQRLRTAKVGIQFVEPADLEAAWTIGQKFSDQDFSVVDRSSFAIMERLRLSRVVSFDAHFAIYRYGTRREKAFEVLR